MKSQTRKMHFLVHLEDILADTVAGKVSAESVH